MIKQEPGLIPGKKKRGRPKKIKNPEEAPPPDPEKMDANGEVIKKRRGRPKKIHQQQKQAEREAKEREHQQHQQHQQHQAHPHHAHQQMSHMSDGGYGSVNCFSPTMMSPPKPFSHMAPYPQSMNDPGGYYGQGMPGDGSSPYSKQSPVHLQHYSQSPKSMSSMFTHSDLSSEINTAISSENNLGEPSPLTSPAGMDHPDFDGSQQQQQQQQQQAYDHGSPAGTPSYGAYMGYHEQQEQQQQHPHQGAPTPMSQTTDEHSHHSHPTPPHNHQHTPTHSMSPHPHEQYGKAALSLPLVKTTLSILDGHFLRYLNFLDKTFGL